VLLRWMTVTLSVQCLEVLSVIIAGFLLRPPRDLWLALAVGVVAGSAIGLQLAVAAIMKAAR
jgi:hypothetical protein